MQAASTAGDLSRVSYRIFVYVSVGGGGGAKLNGSQFHINFSGSENNTS